MNSPCGAIGSKSSRARRASPWRTATIAPARPSAKRGSSNEDCESASIGRARAAAAPLHLPIGRRRQGHDCHVAERAERDQGREDRGRAREGDGELSTFSRRNAGILHAEAGGYSSPGGPEDRKGIWC